MNEGTAMRTAATVRSVQPAAQGDDIRVMVADNSAVVRMQLARWIDETSGLRLVAAVSNGREALDRLKETAPDVLVLDVEMPELDGLATLPQILRKRRDLVVIMASALTRTGAETSLKALSLGAADCVAKPSSAEGGATVEAYRDELIEKIAALGERRRRRPARQVKRPFAGPATRRLSGAIRKAGRWRVPEDAEPSPYNIRGLAPVTPRVLLIGASTGGPQALSRLLPRLEPVMAVAPVLITQHMPAAFTPVFAEHLSRISARPVREAADGEPVLAGTVYLAPGQRHMRVARSGGTAVIALDDGPAIHHCRPAIDPMFESAAQVWGGWNLALVLTGMGRDGTDGAAAIAARGGNVIAQDEDSSVIWSMPGAAVEAGLCSSVLPLDRMAPQLVRLFLGARP